MNSRSKDPKDKSCAMTRLQIPSSAMGQRSHARQRRPVAGDTVLMADCRGGRRNDSGNQLASNPMSVNSRVVERTWAVVPFEPTQQVVFRVSVGSGNLDRADAKMCELQGWM